MTKDQKIQTGFSVKSSSYSEESGDHSDDEFSRGDTHTSHSVEGVVLAFDYPDCVGPFLALPRDEMYIVSVIYSTGDSFGYDHGRGLEHVAVFKTCVGTHCRNGCFAVSRPPRVICSPRSAEKH